MSRFFKKSLDIYPDLWYYNYRKRKEIKKGDNKMKPAYNVRIWNFGDVVLLTWENYAFGKHEHKARSEREALDWLAVDGWEIKTFYKKK
jgi:hypothetical protein